MKTNKSNEPICFTPSDARWPRLLTERRDESTPSKLWALGHLDILSQPKTALFCSLRCPGNAILRAYDQTAKWRDEGRCVISGFHSPIEKECLRILLRGQQPVVISPARSLENFRIPSNWKSPLAHNRLLILSLFDFGNRRITAELAARRNDFVAALADDIWFAHIVPGGETHRLNQKCAAPH